MGHPATRPTMWARRIPQNTRTKPQRTRIRPAYSLPILFLSLLLLLLFTTAAAAYQDLSDNFLRQMPAPSESDFDIHNKESGLLAPILIPRVPGTAGQKVAQEHFVSFFRRQLPQWEVLWQNSTGTTPATGDRPIPFQNLVFRRTPPWTKPGESALLTLVAHYDSKIKPEGFIGAIDSAAPCAVLMHVARSIEGYLTKRYEQMEGLGEAEERRRRSPEGDMGVQILLLDGEEAFGIWTDTDSVYGARSLAEEWENTIYPAKSPYKNPLRQISLFVLLDLLGSAGSTIPSYFLTTHWAYKKMATIESRLRDLGVLESDKPKENPIFYEADKQASAFYRVGMGDDHVPFMARGVSVLHLIPSPFPRVWHTVNDDGEHLDLKTVRDWARITTAFALEWLDMMEVEPNKAGAARSGGGQSLDGGES